MCKVIHCLKFSFVTLEIVHVLLCFQLHDGMWIWEDILGNLEIQNTSGFLLGVYSLWNVFTCMVLIMYPPIPPPNTSQGKLHLLKGELLTNSASVEVPLCCYCSGEK